MTEPSPNGGTTFRIELSALIPERILDLQRQASDAGRGEEYLNAMQAIVDNIRRNARTAGEPLYRLPVMKLQVRLVAVRPLVVHFAVSEERLVVYVKSVVLSQ